MKVPRSYPSRAHYRAKIQQEHDAVALTLPRMTFFMEGLTYDSDRQLNPLLRAQGTSTNANNKLSQFQPVPYDFNFNVSVFSKYVEDGLRIVEQIIPTFSPSYNLTLKEIPSLGIITDVPVILNSVTQEDNFADGFQENRLITWSFDLTVKGNMYQPITDSAVIKQVTSNLTDSTSLTKTLGSLGIGVNPSTAAVTDPYTVVKTATPGSNV